MKKIVPVLAILAFLTICSCERAEMSGKMYENKGIRSYSASIAEGSAVAEPFMSADSQNEEQITGRIEPEYRKVIKQGEISFKTDDINKTKSLISQKVQELGGYISNDRSYEYQQTLVIRVPAGNFDILLNSISENAGKFDNKNVNVLDVTEEYIDVSVRIKTKKELQARYVELLKRASSIDEILKIEREIGNLQTEIESAEGRMKYLKDQIAFSTLTVTFYKEYYRTVSHKFNFFAKFADAVKNGLVIFLTLIIGLSHLWVFIVIAAALICLYKMWKRRKKRKNISS